MRWWTGRGGISKSRLQAGSGRRQAAARVRRSRTPSHSAAVGWGFDPDELDALCIHLPQLGKQLMGCRLRMCDGMRWAATKGERTCSQAAVVQRNGRAACPVGWCHSASPGLLARLWHPSGARWRWVRSETLRSRRLVALAGSARASSSFDSNLRPHAFSTSCAVMEPGRNSTGAPRVQSMMVDSMPTSQGPPSRISKSSPNSLCTWAAVVGLTRPNLLALGAAMPQTSRRPSEGFRNVCQYGLGHRVGRGSAGPMLFWPPAAASAHTLFARQYQGKADRARRPT